MSDKESSEEMDVKEETEADQNKNKTQKRKKPAKASAPAKKKAKVEKKEEPKEEEEKKESTATETEGDSEEDEKPAKGLLDQSPEVTGPRVRKQVERLTVTAPVLESPARKNEIASGKGVKLGSSPKIVGQLSNVKHPDLVLMHRLFFKRPGSAHEIKKNIKEFSGFPFSKDEKEFESRKNLLEKHNMNDLKFICGILNLERGGTKEGLIERILEFCLCPNPSTKAVAPPKKASKSKETKKKTPAKESKGSKSPMKSPTSKEIIEEDDSSSSEDEGGSSAKEEPPASPSPAKKATTKEEAKAPAKAKMGETTPKGKKETGVATTPKGREAKSAKETSQKKKPAARKSPKKAEIKVKLPAVNKAKKKPGKGSETEDDRDKADTSKEEHSDAESGKEDAPKKASPKKTSPAKKAKGPTNDELVATIKEILKDANLDNMTMKNLYKQVHEKYPNSELEKTKKDFIRSTAKQILGSGN